MDRHPQGPLWPGEYSDGRQHCDLCGYIIGRGERMALIVDEEVDLEHTYHVPCYGREHPGWLAEVLGRAYPRPRVYYDAQGREHEEGDVREGREETLPW
jgi:hypothetical protein